MTNQSGIAVGAVSTGAGTALGEVSGGPRRAGALTPDAATFRRRRIVRERMLLLPLLAVAIVAYNFFRVVHVDGVSMEPTFHTGDTLYVLRHYRRLSPIKPGDVIVANMAHGEVSGETIVKRVVFVQNARGDAPWPAQIRTSRGLLPSKLYFQPYIAGVETVPPNAILVLGDNIPKSMDSRDFGPILPGEIEGKVLNP